MATIYAGLLDGSRVAVKLLHPHLAEDDHIRRMFLHEAQLASRLDHPNVVRVLAHGDHEHHGTFIVMEYVEGGDLAALLKSATKHGKRLPVPVAARIAVDLCRGLDSAHSLSAEDGSPLHLIHRDVSPHNVLVGSDGIARLIDFGIAKSDERYTMTRPGQLKGKLAYMAPEQLAHEDDLDQRLDIFAAGVVIWEALTTKRLFKGSDEISIINKVLLSKLIAPSAVHEDLAPLDAVVMKALAREREDRWSSAGELADALEEAMEALGGVAEPEQVGEAVRDLLTDQIAHRQAKIARSSMTPSGLPRLSASSDTISQTPIAAPQKRSPLLWLAVLGLVIGAAAAGAGVMWSTQEPVHPTTVIQAAPAAGAASAAEPEPQPASEPAPEPEAALEPAPVSVTTVAGEPPETVVPHRRRRRTGRAAAQVIAPAVVETAPGTQPADDLIPNPYGD
ncbi:protein kinase [bacterium AH-315-N03]|nr:protein kinase [bacterium AH-315-N03]